MSALPLYPVNPIFAASANINKAGYATLYQKSIDAPEAFWSEQAKEFFNVGAGMDPGSRI